MISLREMALVFLIAACACGAHVLVFYLVARTLKSLWLKLRNALGEARTS